MQIPFNKGLNLTISSKLILLFTNPWICIVNALSFWLEILIQVIIKFIFKNLRIMCISTSRNLNLMLLSWLQVQEHYAKKIFLKAKKNISQLFFPQHLQLLVVMQSVSSYKNITQTLYTDDTYTKTQCCFLVMEGRQFAWQFHSHWGISIHQCFAEFENSILKGFKVPLPLFPYKRYRLITV